MTVQRLYEHFLKIFLDFAHMQKAMLSFGLISSILQFLHAKFNIPTIAIGFKVGNQHRQNPVSSYRYFGTSIMDGIAGTYEILYEYETDPSARGPSTQNPKFGLVKNRFTDF